MSSLRKIKSSLMHFTWDLAIRKSEKENNDFRTISFSDFTVVHNPYKEKWFADPFILSFDGKHAKVLVEEFDNSVNRGRIALLLIDVDKAEIRDCKIVLDIETHLSYPIIYRHNNRIIIGPENADSGHADFYEYDDTKEEMYYLQNYSNRPLADATILNYCGKYFCFCTELPNPNGKVLNVYKANDLMGQYCHFQDIEFNSNIARMGGGFFKDDNDNIIRSAQDCDGDYGKKIVFQELKMNNGVFEFRSISELRPDGIKYAGLHTFNEYKGIQIIDLKKYDHPFVYLIRNIIKNR